MLQNLLTDHREIGILQSRGPGWQERDAIVERTRLEYERNPEPEDCGWQHPPTSKSKMQTQNARNIDANDSTETLGREVCCDAQRGISGYGVVRVHSPARGRSL